MPTPAPKLDLLNIDDQLSTGVGLLASAAAGSTALSSRRTEARAQNVVYWGQNGGGTVENNDLAAYCTSNSGIDIIVLAFLYMYGNGNNIPSGTIGQSCFITTEGQGQNCDAVATSIATCQSAGVKVILSLGGASGSYSLQSQSEAETIGQYLWDSYGNSGNTGVQRPFGNTFVNGFDFDIEVNEGSAYYPYLISSLRSNFAADPHNTYYITGAPQCPIPEPNMGLIIGNATFDYLWIQFYNNNPCSLGFSGNAPFNYDQWVTYLADTPSANAELFIGVPAAPLAANGSPSGAKYYITPDQLASLVGQYKSNPAFGGVMMWNAGFSDANVNNGCTYAQEAHNILLSGSPCSESGSGNSATPATSTASLTSTSSTSTTPSATTDTATVAQWDQVSTRLENPSSLDILLGPNIHVSVRSHVSLNTSSDMTQCGGEGYSGSTLCASPYICVKESVWWSSCQ